MVLYLSWMQPHVSCAVAIQLDWTLAHARRAARPNDGSVVLPDVHVNRYSIGAVWKSMTVMACSIVAIWDNAKYCHVQYDDI
jgi:hypothetical protein